MKNHWTLQSKQNMNSATTSVAEVEIAAIRLLSFREHSQFELSNKLLSKGFPSALIEATIEHCLEHNYLSNFRYTQMMLRVKSEQGYGLNKIKHLIKAQRVDEGLIDDALAEEPIDWYELALNAAKKHSRGKELSDFKQRIKTSRHLQNKGFAFEEINEALKIILAK